MVDIVLERVKIGTIAYEIPIIRSIQHLLEYIRLPRAYIPQIFHSHSDIANVAKFSVESIQNSDHTKNVFSNIAVEAEKGEKLDIPDMVNEAITFIIAGTDTTAVTLTYLLWLVLSRPELQAKLENETATLPVNFAESDVEKLPLLNAVISETLRLHTPAPGALPRIVPPGGAIMGSIPIPAGTIATTQAYTYHRNATLFPEPYEYVFPTLFFRIRADDFPSDSSPPDGSTTKSPQKRRRSSILLAPALVSVWACISHTWSSASRVLSSSESAKELVWRLR